jgi:drug/metabolite transporter (DMT)-like permease
VHSRSLLNDLLLIATALIWGLAFVAQRVGMDHIGPFTYNGIRFLLGAGALIPFALRFSPLPRERRTAHLRSAAVAGLALFAAASLQQIGLVYTSAGNAGFITGLYVVIVPLIGLGRRQAVSGDRWAAVGLAVGGLYLLSVQAGFRVNPGDVYVMASAFFFAVHVQVIDYLARRSSAMWLSLIQYVVVGVASLIIGLLTEPVSVTALRGASTAILYGGLGSISIAYTLQVIAQRKAEPSHAAIILSLEGTFAALGGWLILGEILSVRALVGCILLLSGMLLSQRSALRRTPIPL